MKILDRWFQYVSRTFNIFREMEKFIFVNVGGPQRGISTAPFKKPSASQRQLTLNSWCLHFLEKPQHNIKFKEDHGLQSLQWL